MSHRPAASLPAALAGTALVVYALNASAAPADTWPQCDTANTGITLPDGFCAVVFADGIGVARHLAVADNGDVYAALRRSRRGDTPVGIIALRDTDADGVADQQVHFDDASGTGIALHAGYLYFGHGEGVVRYRLRPGQLAPVGPAETVVSGLPANRPHDAKSIAISVDGSLFVNIGAPSNSCQVEVRTPGSPGQDPCPQLERSAGIWRFDAERTGQTQADGQRFATGLRNVVALALNPTDGRLYGAQHGRDQLAQLWPDLYTLEQSAEKPSEEFVRIEEDDDFGWPYCYHDPELGQLVMSPEYGGDGSEVSRCADNKEPLIAFPAHWAPNGLLFYTGEQFPERYRQGAFIAFHGSWNRAPLPQGGYNVVFIPFVDGEPPGDYEIFADGFAGDNKDPRGADHRPMGLAQGPDGSLYIGDDRAGRIWRIFYSGE